MEVNTTDAGLDLPEKGVDLAALVFNVAKECDKDIISSGSIKGLDGFADEILTQLEIYKIQHEDSQLSEIVKQRLIHSIIAEPEQKKEKLAAENAAKRGKIMRRINGNASEGYKLAYSLCRNDNSDKSKSLKYHMVNHISGISIDEKIEVCQMYAELLIKHGESGNKIARVYCSMAGLVYPQNKRMDCTACLCFYEKAFEYIDEPTWMLREIIGFCNRFGISELRAKCLEKEDTLQSVK